MLWRRPRVRDGLLLVGLVAAAALFALSVVYSGSPLPVSSPAYAEADAGQQAVTHVVSGTGGEVAIDGSVVIRMRAPAGGYSPDERAEIIRERLRVLVGAGIEPEGVYAGMMRGFPAVMAGESLIITADAEHARMNRSSQAQLAEEWATRVAAALGGEPGESELAPPPAAPGDGEWVPAEPFDDKDVPIISLGRGKRVGMARVTGPTSKVKLVQAVVQIESNLQKFGDVEVYVPISTEVPGSTLDRVNECAVVGLADIGL